jgi:hypothetical protein
VTPQPAVAGYVGVEVTMNAQDYSADGVQFEFLPEVQVLALEPSKGPAAGGSLVNVTGSGFSQRAALLGYLSCRFNLSFAPAVWVSEREVHCISPEHAAGVVSVELTQNEQQFTIASVQYEYQHVAIHTLHPGVGPVQGGTLVELRGSHFELPGSRGLYCQFGGAEVVSATHESHQLVRCESPQSHGAFLGPVVVRLINNDAVYTSEVAFTYRSLSTVSRVHPVVGAFEGGTLLTLYGTGFVESLDAYCRFGDVATVPGRLVSAGVLECVTPQPAVAGYVGVEVDDERSGLQRGWRSV